MSVTTLDPHTALIVVDLQKGIAGLPAVHPIAAVTAKAAELASAFRQRGLPVVLVNAGGRAPGRTEQSQASMPLPDDWMDLLPELDPQPQDHRVTKYTWGAFLGTGLESRLKSAGVTQIVLAGVATSMGVESTAREAYALGFNVTLAIDAMTDLSEAAHINSVSRIFPRLGETGTTQEIVALLDSHSV
ncbi:isochorismatase family protein [Paraburkholderia caballeronis]|uniref:Nicotinamidase-related amidase n=1 Tax=Paraburkholderia caballeronis TaxID=416943 RepID=A0A1H7FGQ9_9BURK|nr:isochorismatase family protein [Paraburkholderia caballeronis]PXW24068.1 nicotinamidase-related amidase [Paraburkholderia caballeronis]PXW99832.1 nicotinamidase-related amidase [Paraburkholderia caballeronis]RAJ96786.1 nicotinamidase-related amidase [Paraburkholderia caballeronis]SEE74497.1 Nicotinamidase-related amidase [Paraburkholderia caballeronis]SEK23622.1 Nicotinamidase-related amidase [Paraburkholderia caballeronis]